MPDLLTPGIRAIVCAKPIKIESFNFIWANFLSALGFRSTIPRSIPKIRVVHPITSIVLIISILK